MSPLLLRTETTGAHALGTSTIFLSTSVPDPQDPWSEWLVEYRPEARRYDPQKISHSDDVWQVANTGRLP